MMHNDGMSQLDLLVKRFSPPLLEVSRDSQEEPKLAPGERVQAHVLASMPNGRFQVLIKNQVLDMNLPSNTQPGEQLDLSVVKNQPRLTFAFTSDLQRALPALAPEVKLSDAVKYLGALLSRVEESPANKTATVQALNMPLIASTEEGIDTGKLAHQLQQSLSQSGVFFESHQAEWVVGQRSFSQLMQEPQARLGQKPANNFADSGAPKATGKENHPPSVSAVFEQETVKVSGSESVSRALPERGMNSLPPAEQQQIRELVQQQLNLLDTRQLNWIGMAWPGQPLEWLVQERQADQTSGDVQAPVWYSRLKLDMPHLGEVIAAISLQPGGLQIHFQSNPETARLLQGQKPRLFEQLAAAGLNLLGASVNDEQ
ncbi:MAG: flagellar hook-length control protein FliK [Chitinivorax sp.]